MKSHNLSTHLSYTQLESVTYARIIINFYNLYTCYAIELKILR